MKIQSKGQSRKGGRWQRAHCWKVACEGGTRTAQMPGMSRNREGAAWSPKGIKSWRACWKAACGNLEPSASSKNAKASGVKAAVCSEAALGVSSRAAGAGASAAGRPRAADPPLLAALPVSAVQ